MPLGLATQVPVLARAEPASRTQGLCAPPPWFKAAEGVRAAWPVGGPFGAHPTPSRGGTAAMKLGRRYESKALKHIAGEVGECFKPSVWFRFSGEGGVRFCQLDGLVHEPWGTIIFEIKLRFTSDAWWQLRKLYEPVIRQAYALPEGFVRHIIVCKSFDPVSPFPETFQLLPRLSRASLPAEKSPVCVYQWRP